MLSLPVRRAARVAVGALALLPMAVAAPRRAAAQLPTTSLPQRIVTPSNSPWVPSTRGSQGLAQITGTNPRNGNGSLELHTGGLLTDWGWFDLFAGDPLSASFGTLGRLDHLSFDWFRASDSTPDEPVWQGQSVAFRLFVRSGTVESPIFSELVWESWYNGGQPVPRDTWIAEDLTNQVFWRFVNGSGYTIADCSNPPTITPGIPLKTASPSAWGNGANCYDAGAQVYGIGIGVGSNWPYAFTGFADDVQLGFDGQLVVNDNFELDARVTPEPATWALMATGLVGVAVAARRRRRA